MDAALPLHEHPDVVYADPKEVMGLDDLEPLVGERGAVDGDLGPHGPSGVRKSVGYGHARELPARHAVEGATGARQPDAREICVPLANQALVDGTVLGIDGDEPPGLGKRYEKVARNDDGLLVGVGQGLVCPERRVARSHASLAHNGVHHAVGVR